MAEMLNVTHGRKWRVGEDGRVEIEDGAAAQASQFVALSKVLDATELGLLVRIHMDRLEEVEVPADFHSRGAAGPADVPSQGAAAADAGRGTSVKIKYVIQ